MGYEFPKHIYHSIICIGALLAERSGAGWSITAIGAPSSAERPEKELIEAFVDKIADLSPQMVTFNGSSFDLPVLRYRALIRGVSAPGLHNRAYYHRFTDDAVDLCDVLSSFSPSGKAKLDELCRVMGLDGKPNGMSGADVEGYHNAGRIKEIADYCRSDVLNTYRLWLRYELFRGKLDRAQFDYSDNDAGRFCK
jgi:predicted PolB exonuclease-like 3'-5' exonuclease